MRRWTYCGPSKVDCEVRARVHSCNGLRHARDIRVEALAREVGAVLVQRVRVGVLDRTILQVLGVEGTPKWRRVLHLNVREGRGG